MVNDVRQAAEVHRQVSTLVFMCKRFTVSSCISMHSSGHQLLQVISRCVKVSVSHEDDAALCRSASTLQPSPSLAYP